MGAHNFEDTAVGKTIGEAYGRACYEAEYEYGHEAYNGTISTTNGVRDVSTLLAPFSMKRRFDIASLSLGVNEFDPRFDPKPKRGDYDVLVLVDGRNWTVPKALRPDERATAVRLSQMTQKWGPCIGFEITGKAGVEARKRLRARRGEKAYRFVGWAAS